MKRAAHYLLVLASIYAASLVDCTRSKSHPIPTRFSVGGNAGHKATGLNGGRNRYSINDYLLPIIEEQKIQGSSESSAKEQEHHVQDHESRILIVQQHLEFLDETLKSNHARGGLIRCISGLKSAASSIHEAISKNSLLSGLFKKFTAAGGHNFSTKEEMVKHHDDLIRNLNMEYTGENKAHRSLCNSVRTFLQEHIHLTRILKVNELAKRLEKKASGNSFFHVVVDSILSHFQNHFHPIVKILESVKSIVPENYLSIFHQVLGHMSFTPVNLIIVVLEIILKLEITPTKCNSPTPAAPVPAAPPRQLQRQRYNHLALSDSSDNCPRGCNCDY